MKCARTLLLPGKTVVRSRRAFRESPFKSIIHYPLILVNSKRPRRSTKYTARERRMAHSTWHQMTDEQKTQHREGAKLRRARERSNRTPEQQARLNADRKDARERRLLRDPDHHRAVASEYKRNGKGYFYSWANAISTRARWAGLPCDIDADWLQSNLPTHCPVLGIELKRRLCRTDNSAASPTVDRTIPELGYVRGNMHIISRRANNIKSDANAAEILLVAQWVQTITENQ